MLQETEMTKTGFCEMCDAQSDKEMASIQVAVATHAYIRGCISRETFEHFVDKARRLEKEDDDE